MSTHAPLEVAVLHGAALPADGPDAAAQLVERDAHHAGEHLDRSFGVGERMGRSVSRGLVGWPSFEPIDDTVGRLAYVRTLRYSM